MGRDGDGGAARTESRARRSMRPREEHGHGQLEISASPKTCCSTGMHRSMAIVPRTTRSRPPTSARRPRPFAAASRQQRFRLRGRQAQLSDRHGRNRCLQHDALQCRRLAQRGDLRLRRVSGQGATSDSRGNSNITTPGGERTVSGGFFQLKNNYSTWLEVVSAVRYDRYDLDFRTVSTGGDRFSPKITVGVTPVAGFTPYVSYAEGYRAPSITETLIAGEHATGGGPPFFPCPGGTVGIVLLPAQSEPAAGGRQEQGSRHQLEV